MERRFVPNEVAPVRVERRADNDDQQVIVGYGAVFYRDGEDGTEFQLMSDVFERILPGAFDRALEERDDARGLFNHEPSHLLGRVSAGTMRLSVDGTGLRYEIDVPDTQVGRDVVTSIERGDLSGSSFAFIPQRVSWVEDGDREIRQIEEVQLFDTGPVTFPAYEATSTGLRSLGSVEDVKQERQAWHESKRLDRVKANAIGMQKRARLVELGIDAKA